MQRHHYHHAGKIREGVGLCTLRRASALHALARIVAHAAAVLVQLRAARAARLCEHGGDHGEEREEDGSKLHCAEDG